MRVKIFLTGTNELLPIDNQHLLNSFFHKCLGNNNPYHDAVSDYCLSNLRGGKKVENQRILNFEKGAFFFLTSTNLELINLFLKGLKENVEFGFGMKVKDILFLNEKNYTFKNGYNIFRTLTPILIKTSREEKFLTIEDNDFSEKLTLYMKNKLSKIEPNVNLNNFKIIIKDHPSNKKKLVTVKNVKNFATQCDFIVYGNEKIYDLLYNYGVGKSTGSGFGTIYNVKNKENYEDCY